VSTTGKDIRIHRQKGKTEMSAFTCPKCGLTGDAFVEPLKAGIHRRHVGGLSSDFEHLCQAKYEDRPNERCIHLRTAAEAVSSLDL